jgi:hypothetical protein
VNIGKLQGQYFQRSTKWMLLTTAIDRRYGMGYISFTMDQEQKQVAVRMETADYSKLERIARRMDRSVSWCIRDAIQAYIEANRTAPPQK